MKSVVALLVGSLLIWAALLYPGWLWCGEIAFLHSATAWALCVLPGIAVTAWAMGDKLSAEMRTMAVLAGTGIRMMVVLSGGLVLTELLPETFTKSFWLWVGVFYVLLLALEVGMLVRYHQNHPSESKALRPDA